MPVLSLDMLPLCQGIGSLDPESAEEAIYRDLSALPQHGHARRRFKPRAAERAAKAA